LVLKKVDKITAALEGLGAITSPNAPQSSGADPAALTVTVSSEPNQHRGNPTNAYRNTELERTAGHFGGRLHPGRIGTTPHRPGHRLRQHSSLSTAAPRAEAARERAGALPGRSTSPPSP